MYFGKLMGQSPDLGATFSRVGEDEFDNFIMNVDIFYFILFLVLIHQYLI